MYHTPLHSAEKYNYLNPDFLAAYRFLRREGLEELNAGTVSLGSGITAEIQSYLTIPPESAKFEAHDRFFDIQYIVSGEELFEVADREGTAPASPYDLENDIAFFKEPGRKDVVRLKAGDIAVVSPEEIHKPRVCAGRPGPVRKIVVKIPVRPSTSGAGLGFSV